MRFWLYTFNCLLLSSVDFCNRSVSLKLCCGHQNVASKLRQRLERHKEAPNSSIKMFTINLLTNLVLHGTHTHTHAHTHIHINVAHICLHVQQQNVSIKSFNSKTKFQLLFIDDVITTILQEITTLFRRFCQRQTASKIMAMKATWLSWSNVGPFCALRS